jgi:RNA polymerase sigma-70 factor (ECF subfamily)
LVDLPVQYDGKSYAAIAGTHVRSLLLGYGKQREVLFSAFVHTVCVRSCMANSSYDDQELVKRLQAGDLQALNLLMDRYKDEFYRLGYRIMGNREDAEEVLQDTFLRAYQKISTFEGKSKLSTWLYRICVNRCLNRREGLKKFALTKAFDPAAIVGIQNVPSTQNTEAEYETTELQQHVAGAVAKLKPDQRALVSLYYLQGFSCAEISEILQKPLGTVKTHLFRARNNLKKMLAGLQHDLVC